jgi:hypothetical protein
MFRVVHNDSPGLAMDDIAHTLILERIGNQKLETRNLELGT